MKTALKYICILMLIAVVTCLCALGLEALKTGDTIDHYEFVYSDERYKEPLMIEDVDVIEQEISCGYAVIEMFSAWDGGNITEESLFEQYGEVVTSTGDKFCEEMNRQFPQYKTEINKYMPDTKFIEIMYDTLASGKPVPFEWAAKDNNGQWTIHYSLIIGADIMNDRITVANPYGYYEEVTLKELFDRTSFNAYKNMPLQMRLAFAFGVFEKNTIFSVE